MKAPSHFSFATSLRHCDLDQPADTSFDGTFIVTPVDVDKTSFDRHIAQRSDPPLIVIDRDCNVLFYSALSADDGAESFYEDGRLTPKLETIAVHLLRGMRGGTSTSSVFFATPAAPWFVRVRKLAGNDALREACGECFAITIETLRNRNQLSEARRRFSLTRRESEVLVEILRGASSAEIAANLHLAEGTVQGYYKRLLQRTNAHNRAAMIALVLGWETPMVVRSREA